MEILIHFYGENNLEILAKPAKVDLAHGALKMVAAAVALDGHAAVAVWTETTAFWHLPEYCFKIYFLAIFLLFPLYVLG